MCRPLYEYATEANLQLITEVAGYYNQAREDLVFYQGIKSPTLQKLAYEHLMHWKKELRKLIFQGLNCPKERRLQ
jgi:hypothetical protein